MYVCAMKFKTFLQRASFPVILGPCTHFQSLSVSLDLVNLEHVGDVGQDVHVVAEEADVVDAVIADGVAHPDSRSGSRLEEGGESKREKTFLLTT